MKSILIIGASYAGKSTTMREVCKRLKPTKVYRLFADKEELTKSKVESAQIDEIFNNTFIIEVKGKLILVVAGATTEQNITITILVNICVEIGIEISFALVSMRSFERREGFDTPTELKSKSEIILTEKIYRIKDEKFETTTEWNERIDKIVEKVKSNI